MCPEQIKTLQSSTTLTGLQRFQWKVVGPIEKIQTFVDIYNFYFLFFCLQLLYSSWEVQYSIWRSQLNGCIISYLCVLLMLFY